jgi:hypothetical protein
MRPHPLVAALEAELLASTDGPVLSDRGLNDLATGLVALAGTAELVPALDAVLGLAEHLAATEDEPPAAVALFGLVAAAAARLDGAGTGVGDRAEAARARYDALLGRAAAVLPGQGAAPGPGSQRNDPGLRFRLSVPGESPPKRGGRR